MANKVAGRLETVLSTAIAEKRVPIPLSSLPSQFYDLQYSSLDIDDALRLWTERVDRDHHLSDLNPIASSTQSAEIRRDVGRS